MKSSINKQSKIIIGAIALFISVAVGYALFSQSLDIKGTASAEGEFDIIFESVNKISEQGSKNAQANIINEGKELSIEVPNLEYPTAYANINVTIKNNGTMAAKVTGIKVNGLETEDITVTYSGVDNGDILNIEQQKNMDVKVQWDEDSVSTSANAEFTITITYEQVTDSTVTEPEEPEQSDLFTWSGPTTVSGLSEKGIEQVKSNNGHLVIPEGVTEIAGTSMQEASETGYITTGFSPFAISKKTVTDNDVTADPDYNIVKSVSFPSTLKKIGDCAFFYCQFMTGDLVFPDSLEEIGESAFMINQVSSIKFGNNLKTIGNQAFYMSLSLSGELYFPDSLTYIGKEAFWAQYDYNNFITSISISADTRYETDTFTNRPTPTVRQ